MFRLFLYCCLNNRFETEPHLFSRVFAYLNSNFSLFNLIKFFLEVILSSEEIELDRIKKKKEEMKKLMKLNQKNLI